MTVALCNGCQRMISISMIPGGNPVATADSEAWASSYGSCPVCKQLYCEKCLAAEPLCPDCPGPPKPPSLESMARQLNKMCLNRDHYTDGELSTAAWRMSSWKSLEVQERIRWLEESLDPAAMAVLREIAATDYAEALETEKSPDYQEFIARQEQEPEEEVSEEFDAWAAQWPSWEYTMALAGVVEEEGE